MKHANVALFVPHEGCPHCCSFCNQRTISGAVDKPDPKSVESACEIAVKSGGADPKNSEIAFFGGSFTAIDEEYMISLLESAKRYIDKKYFKGIRISTRPDCIDRHKLEILKRYGVTSIELGAQSMDDGVLELNNRGHSAQDVRDASGLIKDYGFGLGLQMMTGLYGSDWDRDIFTAEELIKLRPDTVRIYPTVVLENTELARKLETGEYTAQSLDEAVKLCARLLLMFRASGIKVIRLGLHSGGSVEDGYIAGAYHPAFRELCEGEIYLKKMLELLRGKDQSRQYIIEVGKKSLSKAIGQSKRNEKALKKAGFYCKIKGNDFLDEYEMNVKEL